MKISKHFAVFCLLPAILAINACSGLTQSDRPATNTWWLEPYTDMSGLPSSDPALLVAVSVTVVPGLDTDRILTLSQKSQLNHYSGARWADNLPELLTSMVTRTIQASPRFELAAGGPEDIAHEGRRAVLATTRDDATLGVARIGFEGVLCARQHHHLTFFVAR